MLAPKTPQPIEEIFSSYPRDASEKLASLRQWIFEVADADERIGPLQETLKWGQPSYLPSKTKSGTTVRIDANTKTDGCCALYVHCNTDLVGRWRDIYGDVLKFEGNRAVIFPNDVPLPEEAVKHCIAMALTYHLK